MSRLTELIDYYDWKVNELEKGYEVATRYMETGEIKEYNAGCQRVEDTLEALKELQHYKKYLDEVVEQLEALPNLAKLIERDEAIKIVKGGAK